MRQRIAAVLMGPVIACLLRLHKALLWLYSRVAGISLMDWPVEVDQAQVAYDFAQDSSFSELMESAWFQAALKAIQENEAGNQAAMIRKCVQRREFEEAQKAEAAMTVFEDLDIVFKNYAQEYKADQKH